MSLLFYEVLDNLSKIRIELNKEVRAFLRQSHSRKLTFLLQKRGFVRIQGNDNKKLLPVIDHRVPL